MVGIALAYAGLIGLGCWTRWKLRRPNEQNYVAQTPFSAQRMSAIWVQKCKTYQSGQNLRFDRNFRQTFFSKGKWEDYLLPTD